VERGTEAVTGPERPTALITGASGGIGLELARLCAKGGHDVVLVARNREKLQEIARYLSGMYGVRAEVVVADLRDEGAPAAILDEVAARGLAVDVLINNAGIGLWGLFGRQELARILEVLQVNLTALTVLTRLVLPRMVSQRRGRILNVGSAGGFAAGPLMATYFAAKAYVLCFSEAIAEELRGTGVTVTALCPGPVPTGFGEAAGQGRSNLQASPLVLDAATVAAAGYRGMMRGRRVVVPGLGMKAVVFSIRLGPRRVATRIARWFQEQKA
jgi:short-subunit dehydrogenase